MNASPIPAMVALVPFTTVFFKYLGMNYMF